MVWEGSLRMDERKGTTMPNRELSMVVIIFPESHFSVAEGS